MNRRRFLSLFAAPFVPSAGRMSRLIPLSHAKAVLKVDGDIAASALTSIKSIAIGLEDGLVLKALQSADSQRALIRAIKKNK